MRKQIFAAAFFSLALSFQPFAAAAGVTRVDIPETAAGVPPGWTLKEWKGKADLSVAKAEFGPVFHLKSNVSSSALYRKFAFDIRKEPVLRWRWKATVLPPGGDVRKRRSDDQAAQVYVLFPRFPESINTRFVGYIWDSTAPQGSRLLSTKSSNIGYIVLRSGPRDLGRWLEERRNVYEDYKALFNEEPPEAGGVSVMIDSDDTKSSAESFIGGIYFSSED